MVVDPELSYWLLSCVYMLLFPIKCCSTAGSCGVKPMSAKAKIRALEVLIEVLAMR